MMLTAHRIVYGPFLAVLIWLPAAAGAADANPEQLAAEILRATGIRGGLVVHLGCGQAPAGALTAALCAGPGYLVQGWDADAEKVAQARQLIQAKGLYGPVSVGQISHGRLPYIDNLINLIVVSSGWAGDREELLRVLAPQGVAYLNRGGSWDKIVKPRPAEIDDWTHYLYDARGNAVSNDSAVAEPRRVQWVGGPRYGRHHDHMSSVSAVVSGGGRVFYIFDTATRFSVLTPPDWRLIARDAFNGTILWQRKIEHWFTHLWPLKSGPAQLPRRLVADGQRVFVTLGINAPISALDAATGETVRTYPETAGAEEMLVVDGLLCALVNPALAKAPDDGSDRYAGGYRAKFWNEEPRQVVGLDADTGRVLWTERRRVLPGTLAADGQRVVFHDGQSVVCLNQRTGEPQWRSEPVPRSQEIQSFYVPTLLLYKDVVLFSGGETAGRQTGSWYREGEDTMTALAAKDGRVLWKSHHPPSGYRSAEDLLVVNDLVWTGETTSGRAEGTFTGRDVRTGQVKAEFHPHLSTYWFHHRCYRGKATCNFLLMSRAGTEFLDVRKQTWTPHHWVRGACLYGIMPANGLIYAPQHPCACYLEAKMSGFSALAPAGQAAKRRAAAIGQAVAGRLERGPAYGDIPATKSARAGAEDWPTFRHDPARSGHASTTVPARLKSAWKTEIGGRLSSPVVADGRLFVASIDRHTVHALDAGTGRKLWQFTAGGRVDSPPTVYRGMALFGSADGHVYALRASDGRLTWRFRAAPLDERMTAFEQIESVWPVHGSVLVQDGVLYCVAGRSMFVDGGLRFLRLEPQTGKLLSETVLDESDPKSGKTLQDYVSWLNMPTALPDILSSDGRRVYMRGQPFHLDGRRLPLAAMPTSGDADAGAPPPTQDPDLAHLFSPTGFLDDDGWHRSYWMYGSRFVSGWSGYFTAGKAAPAGKILAFDENRVYGFGRKPQYFRWTTPIEHHLFAADKRLSPPEEPRSTKAPTRVRVDKSASLKPEGKPLAVAAWIRADQADGVVLARGGSALGYTLYLQNGRPHFSVRARGELGTVTAQQQVTKRWVHLAGVLTAEAKLQLYVDGQLAATSQAPAVVAGDPQEAMEIGADEGSLVGSYAGPLAFSGAIDEVRVFKGAPTAGQIAHLAAGKDAPPAGGAELVLAYSFEQGQAKDASAFGNHGRLEGAEAVAGKVGKALQFVGGPARVPGYRVPLYWTAESPVWVRALVLAGGVLFAAGPPDLVDEEQAFREFKLPAVQQQLAEQAAAFAGQRGGRLRAVSAADGKLLNELTFESPPVFGGMAAAGARLFLCTEKGSVLCFGE